MYPNEIIPGMDLYDIFLVLGVLSALWFFRFQADRLNFSARYQNFCLGCGMIAIFGGLGAAVLTQAFYNYMATGVFKVADDTGATFYGGLVGGALVFLLCYFTAGRFLLPKGEAGEKFFALSEIASVSIALAHASGRLGCMFVGCCHGAVTDAWYGMYNAYLDVKTVPVQLMEAVFLFALAGLLFFRICKKKKGQLGLYLVSYGVWRFFVEYLRTDYRGETVVSFLTPSQLVSLLLIAVGVGLWVLEYLLNKKKRAEERV